MAVWIVGEGSRSPATGAGHAIGPVRTYNLPTFRGAGYIAGELPDGLTKINGTPAPCDILLVHYASSMVVLTTTSAADGTYQFDNVDPAIMFEVLFRDPDGTYNSEVVTGVYPEPY